MSVIYLLLLIIILSLSLYIYIDMWVYVCMYVCVYIYIYTHTYHKYQLWANPLLKQVGAFNILWIIVSTLKCKSAIVCKLSVFADFNVDIYFHCLISKLNQNTTYIYIYIYIYTHVQLWKDLTNAPFSDSSEIIETPIPQRIDESADFMYSLSLSLLVLPYYLLLSLIVFTFFIIINNIILLFLLLILSGI